MHIYLFHNQEESGPGVQFQTKSIEWWDKYFSYHDDSSAYAFGQVICRKESWKIFKAEHTFFSQTFKGEKIKVQPPVQAASASEGQTSQSRQLLH
jgi:hypothetical protein